MESFKLNFKRSACLLLALSLLFTCFMGNVIRAKDNNDRIIIASTTDMHGRFLGYNNSFLNVSTAVKGFRKDFGKNTLILDNGDIFQGTKESLVNLFQGEFSNIIGKEDLGNTNVNPVVHCLRDIGYDAITLGNHEFNYPYGKMKNFYRDIEANGGPTILAANIYTGGTDKCAFTPWITKNYTVNGKSFKIGVVGFEHMNTGDENLKSNWEGLAFSHPNNKERSIAFEYDNYVAYDANTGKKILKNGKNGETDSVDFVVVSYHNSSDRIGSIDATLRQKEEDDKTSMTYLVKSNNTIDLVIAGHDHIAAIKETQNKDSKNIKVLNAGGKNIATATLTLKDNNGDLEVESIEYENRSLSERGTNDRNLFNANPIKAALNYKRQICDNKLGEIVAKDWDMGVSEYDLKSQNRIDIIKEKFRNKNNDTTSLVLKSMIWSAQKNMGKNSGNWISAYGPGFGVAKIKPNGFTVEDCLELCHYDNSFYIVEISGKQLKAWMEAVASLCEIKDGKYKWLNSFSIVVFYGVNFNYNISKPIGNRVEDLVVASTGEKVTDDTKFNLVLDNYQYHHHTFKDAMGNPVNYLWSSIEQMGVCEGLIKFQLAKYVREKKEIKHDTYSKWGVCGLN